MTISRFKSTSVDQYRWIIFGRCILAVVFGFLIANLTVPVLGLLFTEHRALATYSGLLISFTVWLLIILYVFSTRTAIRAWLVISSILLVMSVLYLLLRWWRT